MGIPRLFSEEGEPAFRAREARLVQGIADRPGQVIACGGGVALDPTNIAALKRHAVVVFLRAEPATILKRVSHSRKRPLLNTPDRAGAIDRLMTERAPLYEDAADITVQSGGQGVRATAEQVISRLERYEGFRF